MDCLKFLSIAEKHCFINDEKINAEAGKRFIQMMSPQPKFSIINKISLNTIFGHISYFISTTAQNHYNCINPFQKTAVHA